MLVCTLGDLLLDVIVRLDRPFTRGDDAPARTATGAGGQAANVAAWAVALGAQARFVGKRGDDEAGRLAAGALETMGVQLRGPVEHGRNGVVVSLVDPDGQRTMASDRGVSSSLRADELDVSWFGDCDWLHVAGYSLLVEGTAAAAERAALHARAGGARVSLDCSSWTAIEALGVDVFRERAARLEPELVFGTGNELELVGAGLGRAQVSKHGPDGFVDADRKQRRALPGAVVDTTGAGDALAAGYLVGGPELAAEAAARCVAKLGAMP